MGLSRRAATNLLNWGVPYVLCLGHSMLHADQSPSDNFRRIGPAIVRSTRISMCDYLIQLNFAEQQDRPMWQRALWLANQAISLSLPLSLPLSPSLYLPPSLPPSLSLSLSLPLALYLSISLSLSLPLALYLSISLSLSLARSRSLSLALFLYIALGRDTPDRVVHTKA